jgi:transposase InsO family protein
MCQFFGVSRAAYYVWVKRLEQSDPNTDRIQLIEEAYEKSHRTYGYRRIAMWISKNKGVVINRKAVLRLMNRLNIHSVARKRKIYKKVTELGTYHRYENILNREFTASCPNQKWVTDITYIATQQGWCYLSTIKDLYDGFIVAHRCDPSNSVALVTRTVQQAKQTEKITDGLILHSDQGSQYTSQAYHDLLINDCHITPSMSRRGNCWDNALMENFFGHLKEEYLRQFKKTSFKETEQLIDEYIYFYNYERIQLKTKQTPYETRCLSS